MHTHACTHHTLVFDFALDFQRLCVLLGSGIPHNSNLLVYGFALDTRMPCTLLSGFIHKSRQPPSTEYQTLGSRLQYLGPSGQKKISHGHKKYRYIHCVHEEKISSLTAGDDGNFVSVRLVRIIAYFSWIWDEFISFSYFLSWSSFQKLFREPVTWAPWTGAGPRTTTLRTTGLIQW